MPPCPHHCPPDGSGSGSTGLAVAAAIGGFIAVSAGLKAAEPALGALLWLILAALLAVCAGGTWLVIRLARDHSREYIGQVPGQAPTLTARQVRPVSPRPSRPALPTPAAGQRPGSGQVIPGRVISAKISDR